MPTQDFNAKYEKIHRANLARYQKAIDKIYDRMVDEAAKIGLDINVKEGEDFSFDKLKDTRKRMNDLVWRIREETEKVISDGVSAEWDLSEAKNAALVDEITKGTKLDGKTIKEMQPHNADALQAFQARKTRGLGLSDRIWNITSQAKSEMEMCIDMSLAKGKSAQQLSRDVRHLLKNPDEMWRRYHVTRTMSDGTKKKVVEWRHKVVDDQGFVHFVKEPLTNVGRGVYRSSYRNAMRLARTETNMAYHKADSVAWEGNRWCIGIEIVLSNNHTCLGSDGKPHEFYDICDELQGKYPKEFVFTGWHPQCRCVAVPITPSRDEIVDFIRRRRNGEDLSGIVFKGEVTDMPDNFLTWCKNNEQRLARMQSKGTVPYFIRDNFKAGFRFNQGFDAKDGLRWNKNGFTFDTDEHGNMIAYEEIELDDVIPVAEQPEKKEDIVNMLLAKDAEQYTPKQRENFQELERLIGQKRGLSMGFEAADTGKENPNFLKKKGYDVNCQTCTIAHELRRRGFNVEAVDNYRKRVWKVYDKHNVGYRAGKFLFEDGRPVNFYYAEQWIKSKGGVKMTSKRLMEFLDDVTKHDGRYEIVCDWKGGSAHVFCAERKDGVLSFFDPQTGKHDIIQEYIQSMKPGMCGVLRMDNKIINPKLAELFKPIGELPIETTSRIDRIRQAIAKHHQERDADAIREAWKLHKRKDAIRRAIAKHHAERDADAIREAWHLHKRKDKIRRQVAAKHQQFHPGLDDEGRKELARKMFAERKARYDAFDAAIASAQNRGKSYYDWINADEFVALSTTKARAHLDKAFDASVELARRMDVIDVLKPEYDKYKSYSSQFASYTKKVEELRTLIGKGDETMARLSMSNLDSFKEAELAYENMRKYNTKSGKIISHLDKAKDLMEKGDYTAAKVEIEAAEEVRRINEASKLSKAKKKESVVKEKPSAPVKKSIAEAESYEELKEILGDDMPKLLKDYEASVVRDAAACVDSRYIAERANIERKMKEFFDSVDFGHWEHIDYLDERILDNGFLNTFQVSAKGDWYNKSRYSYAHFAYNCKKVGNEHYYRCGVPMHKDKNIAFREQAGDEWAYGSAQVRFRKDKVVTTWTYKNSLSTQMIPSLTCDPKVCSFDSNRFANYLAAKYDSIPKVQGSWHDYIEIQYLPMAKSGKIMPSDVESIVLPKKPTDIHPKRIWDRWNEAGVDIYYYDTYKGEVVLYSRGRSPKTIEERRRDNFAAVAKKHKERGLTIEQRHALAVEKAEQHRRDIEKAKVESKKVQKMPSEWEKDLDMATLNKRIKQDNYFGIIAEANRLKGKITVLKKELKSLEDLIPDTDKWHKQFTVQELKEAHDSVQRSLDRIERVTGGDLRKMQEKIVFEAGYVKNPGAYKVGATRHRTWEVAESAYSKKLAEVTLKIKREDTLKALDAFKAKGLNDKYINRLLEEADDFFTVGDYDAVNAKLKEIEEFSALKKKSGILSIGETNGQKFSADEFLDTVKKVAQWYENPQNPQAAFDAVDKVMSVYAEELWKNLTQAEKEVLYLYTSGSRYINEPFFTYYGSVKYGVDGRTIRSSEKDINMLTSIIDKAPPLKEGIFVEHVEDSGAFAARFGVNLKGIKKKDLSSLVGIEGVNEPFMSTSCAADSYFTKIREMGLTSQLGDKDVVMKIYLPKGTKGVYCEPFAHYGDGKTPYGNERGRYQKDGYKWDGTSRQEQGYHASDQVEFLLQRGAKFRITGVQLGKDGKWHVDCELIEQVALDKFKMLY